MHRLTRFVVAPLLVLGGLWYIAMPFAFATMLDPDDAMTRAEYLGAVWRRGATGLALGLALVVGGIYLGSSRRTTRQAGP